MPAVKATKCEIKIILNSINNFNLNKVARTHHSDWTELNYVIKNLDDTIVGGILAGIGYWSGLEIRTLWVDEKYRGQGIGTYLLKSVEQEAIVLGAVKSILNTYDFQAKDFYQKMGYKVFGELKDFPNKHSRYYLTKNLLY